MNYFKDELLRWCLLIALTALGVMIFCVYNSGADEIDVERLADAIFLAEGGYHATYLYGIRSVPYKSIEDARRICINTIKNNLKRFKKQDKYDDYLEFLASRYCPVNAENDPLGLNRNWLKNIRYFYKESKCAKTDVE